MRCWWSLPEGHQIGASACTTAPKFFSNARFSATSTSCIGISWPRSARLVTPNPSSEIAAGRDAAEMAKVWLDVEADAVERDPALEAHPYGRDLVLAQLFAGVGAARPGAIDPHTDTACAPLALEVELGQRVDDPLFEAADERLHVASSFGEVEHHIGHALAGAVIGELAAAPRVEDRKAAGIQKVVRSGARALRCRAGGAPPATPARPLRLPEWLRRGLPWRRPPPDSPSDRLKWPIPSSVNLRATRTRDRRQLSCEHIGDCACNRNSPMWGSKSPSFWDGRPCPCNSCCAWAVGR